MKRFVYCTMIATISFFMCSCETDEDEFTGFASNKEGIDYAPENPSGLTICGICGWIDF